MKIRLNGDEVEITATHLAAALEELGYADAVVATALNGNFVPREGRERMDLVEGDELEVVAPLQGG